MSRYMLKILIPPIYTMAILTTLYLSTFQYNGLRPSENDFFEINSTVFSSREEKQSDFLRCWRLQHDMRTKYDRIQAPCQHNMSWQPFDINRRTQRTSAIHSKLSMNIQPAGQYSKVLIKSYNWMNYRRKVGGDSWRIHVRGTTSVPVTVVDNMDGSYEAIFLITEPGLYEVRLYLDYSLCDGYKDPPPDWFINGNEQGRDQTEKELPGHYSEKPFLEEKFLRDLSFNVTYSGKQTVDEEMKDRLLNATYIKESCYMFDGFGRWMGNTWNEYAKDSYKRPVKKHETGKGVLWIVGDSVSNFFYKSILRTSLCSQVFGSCNITYRWIYNIGNIKLKKDEDFDINKVLLELTEVLRQPQLDNNSALVLNYGLHYAMIISYVKFQEMVSRIIHLLQEERKKGFQAEIIWKTTTALWKWRTFCRNSNSRHEPFARFLTPTRIELFNAYSTSKMCEAGFNVLDIYPMSFSYPKGTRNFCDSVHYDDIVFKPVEKYMYEYFNNTLTEPGNI